MTDLGYTAQKIPRNRKPRRRNMAEKILTNKYLFRLLGMLIAMAVPYGSLAPFGLSFLAQERKLTGGTLFSFAAVSVGSVLVCNRLDTAKYICAGLIYIAVLFVLDKDVKMKSVTSALVAGAGVFVAGVVSLWWQGFVFADFLLLLCEVSAVVAGAFVVEKCITILESGIGEKKAFDTEEKLSLAATVCLVVLGLKEVFVGSEFSVMNFAAVVILLIVASGCGATYSTGTGIVLGLICGLGSDNFLPILGSFGFCGFMAGLFSRFGKGGVAAAVVLANGMLVIYTNDAMESILSLYEIIAAALVFMFVKKNVLASVGEVVCIDAAERAGIKKVKELLKERLCAVSASLETMAKTVESFSDGNNKKNTADIATVFDMAADKVCKKCRNASICWNKDFDFTYQSLFELMRAMDKNGTVSPCDVNEKFQSRCVNFPRLVAELNHQLDMNQFRLIWQTKVDESRNLVGEQLSGVSKVIDGLSSKIESDIAFRTITAGEVEEKFAEKDIEVYRVKVSGDGNGRQIVELCIKRKLWNDRVQREAISIMKGMFKGEITLREKGDGNEYFATIEFCDAEKFVVETNFAERAASEKNGDSYRFSHISGGKYVIALSDGMGTGQRAAKESEAMLELLDSFLRAGFDSRMAVKFLNSIMLMKADEEAFVTMDVCIIDLYTGEAEFIKTGAEPSFIMRSNSVDTVKAASLPVGVIAEMEAEISSKSVKDGDVIVMATDGVESRECGNMWIGEFISELGGEKTEKNLAKEILEHAIKKNNGEVRDDMTVLSIRVRCA